MDYNFDNFYFYSISNIIDTIIFQKPMKETLQEHDYRLKLLAKQSKDTSKQFRYIANGVNRIILNKP